MAMTMPNFLVIGAAKCGTDSLCNYLAQHPDIYVPANREPNFFVAEGQSDIPYMGPSDRAVFENLDMWVYSLDRYQALFAGVTTERAIGEGTAWYIFFEDTPTRIKRHIPDAKLIAILRNPVDRAYSAYTMLLRDGRETIGDFARALAAEEDRRRRNWDPIWFYVKMGFYTSQLKRYYATFDPGQIHVIVYDDFNARPLEVMKKLYRFLDVDEQFTPDTSQRYNVSLVPKNLAMHTLVAGENPLKATLKTIMPRDVRQAIKRRIVERNLSHPSPMAPEVRRQLVDVFRADVLELQQLIGRDLSHWLQ